MGCNTSSQAHNGGGSPPVAVNEVKMTLADSKNVGKCPVDHYKLHDQNSSQRPGVCPFKHGTIYADPYPGYVQGKHPQVCKSGCQPTTNPFPNETPAQMFKREAKEYQ
eukprot:gene36792-44632_t